MLEINKLCAGYGKHDVLHELSACFEKGQLTSIIGVNGCGKSTLLKAMLGMVEPQAGQISIDGQALADMSRNQIAKKIAYLAQGRNTPDMSVSQLVLHGRFPHLSYPRRYSSEDREIARSAMEQLGITEYAHRPLPSLSGGMRQNAYIAMALAQGSDYLLLDEPTTYLDIAHQLELMKTLRTLAKEGKGIVAVMHDLPMAFSFSQRILLMDKGRSAAFDSPSELCRSSEIRRIFGVSLEASPDGKSYSYKY